MAFYVEEDCISITRGDDAVLDVSIFDMSGNPYEMNEGDTITLTVKEAPADKYDVIFSVTSDNNRIVFRHEDTADVQVGRYSADIQLMTADGKRNTIWPERQGNERYSTSNYKNFIIMPEVTQV